MKDTLRDFIHNGEPIPSDLYSEDNGYLLTQIAGDYIDNADMVRGMIALRESRKCHQNNSLRPKETEE